MRYANKMIIICQIMVCNLCGSAGSCSAQVRRTYSILTRF